jgi:hypothetical protein
MNAQAGFGGKPRAKREVVDVPEPKPEDKSLDKLLNVRKQRIDRFERERREAREAWREKRQALRQAKLDWRAAKENAKEFWRQARAEFLGMVITSGQYQRAKAMYQRLKDEAAQQHLHCLEHAATCRAAVTEFFQARVRVLTANMQQEKLTILRDEVRRLNQPVEA